MRYEELNNTTPSDVKFWGDSELFKLISKSSSISEGWVRMVKAMQAGKNIMLSTSTQQRNPDGTYVVSEALSLIPSALIVEEKDANGVVTNRYIQFEMF